MTRFVLRQVYFKSYFQFGSSLFRTPMNTNVFLLLFHVESNVKKQISKGSKKGFGLDLTYIDSPIQTVSNYRRGKFDTIVTQ